MAYSVIMPKLGLTMAIGRVANWLVEEGAVVKKGQILAEIESDKAIMQVEAPADGILGRIIAPKGKEVPVGEVIAWVLSPGEAVPQAELLMRAEAIEGTVPGVEAVAEAEAATKAQAEPKRVSATPHAKQLARELGVDLSLVTGTGPGGRITGDDVKAFMAMLEEERAKAVPVAEARPAEFVPLSGVRRTIAERMAASHTTTARVTLFTEADATHLVEWRERLKLETSRQGVEPPSYNDLLIKVTAAALREFPYMNASLTEDGIQQWPQVNIGLAVDSERGLLVPVVRDADRKSVWEIAQEVKKLVARTRDGTITPDELHGGTFTVTNLGMYGVDGFTPIINLPECAILGVGRIVAKPVVWDGQICIRQGMILSLTFDHRIVDGAAAARFLQRVAQFIEAPYLLI